MQHWLSGIGRPADSRNRTAFYIMPTHLMRLSSAVTWRMDHLLMEATTMETTEGGCNTDDYSSSVLLTESSGGDRSRG